MARSFPQRICFQEVHTNPRSVPVRVLWQYLKSMTAPFGRVLSGIQSDSVSMSGKHILKSFHSISGRTNGWKKGNTADLNELQAEGDKNIKGRGTHFNTARHDLANVSVLISPFPDGNGHKVFLLSRETGNSCTDSALAEKTTPRTCSYLSD